MPVARQPAGQTGLGLPRAWSRTFSRLFSACRCPSKVFFGGGDAIKAEGLNANADLEVLLQPVKKLVEDARIGSTTHPGIDGVQYAEALRQGSPFSTGFINMNARFEICTFPP